MTWVDVLLYECLDNFVTPKSPLFTNKKPFKNYSKRTTCLEDRKALKSFLESIRSNPIIEKHLKERPGDDIEPF